jgi:hypothetical protein
LQRELKRRAKSDCGKISALTLANLRRNQYAIESGFISGSEIIESEEELP